jgi:hypothetical protein
MPAWLLSIITSLVSSSLPALMSLLKIALQGLEKTYPGIAPLVAAILAFLSAGGSASKLHVHLSTLDGFANPEV